MGTGPRRMAISLLVAFYSKRQRMWGPASPANTTGSRRQGDAEG